VSHTIKIISEVFEPSAYGNKAYWLSWLFQNGYSVPYAIFLPAVETFQDLETINITAESLRMFLNPLLVGSTYDIAVRSSATCEDMKNSSLAGHFQTIIGRMTLDEVMYSIKQVIMSLGEAHLDTTCRMGVILQKRVDAQFSGVAFSSNPITGQINQGVISIISGMGGALVSGQMRGEDVILTFSNDNIQISPYASNIEQEHLKKIGELAKNIEWRLAHPVDIEWCIEKNTGTLYILQCRPATEILRQENLVVPICIKNTSLIPPSIADNKKVSIRLSAEEHGTPISRAYLVFLNRTGKSVQIPPLDVMQPSHFCKGYSVVLIHPKTVAGKVIRTFSGLQDLAPSIETVGAAARESIWMSVVIVQEVFDPVYTGIAKKIDDGYIIEIARGHFVPKGTVATSQYITDTEGTVKRAKEISQTRELRILDGKIFESTVSVNDSLVAIPYDQVRNIVQVFLPFLQNSNVSVEFGMLKLEDDNVFYPYLIDLIEEQAGFPITSQMALEGVLSKGRITGKLVSFEPNTTQSTLDTHFHDEQYGDYGSDDPKIFLCDTPHISLVEIIRTHDPSKLGFIFREASVLCHLAIILREKGIPALQIEQPEKLPIGSIVTIDAVSSGLRAEERITYVQ